MNPALVTLLWALSVVAPTAEVSNPGAPESAVAPSGPMARVKVSISAPADVSEQIQYYVAQSLQTLDNVQLVDETPRWTIEIVTATLRDEAGQIQGIGLSFVILEHGPQMHMLATMAQAWRYVMAAGFLQDPFIKDGMAQLVGRVDSWQGEPNLTVLSQHRMCVIPLDQLEAACREIVTSFDTQFLRSPAANEAGDASASVAPAAGATP